MRILTSGANGDKQVYSYGRVKTEDANGNVLTRVEKGTTHTHVYDEGDWQKSVTVGGTTTRYYYAGGARVAMLDGATLKYLLGDHLGSTAITTNNTGARQTELRYFAYGKTRYAFGAQPTSFKYTGQRQQVNANEMYFYGARWYDAYLNRWIQPDPTVPRPGDPQSLNRYSYAANNPLRFVDPSGLAECAAGDQQCWTNEWNWKNRWYNAHGYSWGGSHWSVVGNPTFADEGITDDVISEAGISLASAASPSPWSWDNKKKVAYGAASIGQSLSTGMAGLRALLGGHAQVTLGSVPFYCNGGCAPPPPWADGHTVFLPIGPFNAQGLLGGAQWVVHELAHVMDWQGNFSTRWNVALTQYAEHANTPFFNEQRWDRWAEAVAVWAFGGVSAGGGFVTSYKPGEVGQRINANALTCADGSFARLAGRVVRAMQKLICLALIVMLALASCTAVQPTTLDCDQLTGGPLRAQIGKAMPSEQLRKWASDTFHLPISGIRAEVLSPGILETVEWQRDGITFRSTIEGGKLVDVRVSYGARQPPADRLIACLGTPERYRASYEQMVEGNQLGLDLLFASEGGLAYGGKVMRIEQKQPPLLDGTFPISGLTMVEPGTADQVLREIWGEQSNGTYEQMLRTSKPWPGEWKSIVIDIDPAITK